MEQVREIVSYKEKRNDIVIRSALGWPDHSVVRWNRSIEIVSYKVKRNDIVALGWQYHSVVRSNRMFMEFIVYPRTHLHLSTSHGFLEVKENMGGKHTWVWKHTEALH